MKNTNELYQLIGLNLKKVREKLNITQEKMAEDINMSRSHLSKIEGTNVDVGVSIDTLFIIASTYNIDIRNFFEGYEQFIKKDNK